MDKIATIWIIKREVTLLYLWPAYGFSLLSIWLTFNKAGTGLFQF